MHRREVLALLTAGTTGLAGCSLNQSDDPTATGTPIEPPGADATPTPTPTETPPPDREISVSFDALQPAYVELFVDAYELRSTPGAQYLFFDVDVESGRPPALGDFVLQIDGTDYAPMPRDTTDTIVRGRDLSLYDDDRYQSGWMVFELPKIGETSDVRLTWPGVSAAAEWRPDPEILERLAAPFPSLSLEAWHTPETIPVTRQAVTFEFTIANEADLPGHFVGAIHSLPGVPDKNLVAVVSWEIPPNETVSRTVDASANLERRAGWDHFFELLWCGGDPVKRPVQVVEE